MTDIGLGSRQSRAPSPSPKQRHTPASQLEDPVRASSATSSTATSNATTSNGWKLRSIPARPPLRQKGPRAHTECCFFPAGSGGEQGRPGLDPHGPARHDGRGDDADADLRGRACHGGWNTRDASAGAERPATNRHSILEMQKLASKKNTMINLKTGF